MVGRIWETIGVMIFFIGTGVMILFGCQEKLMNKAD
jgi:hypothetical protein